MATHMLKRSVGSSLGAFMLGAVVFGALSGCDGDGGGGSFLISEQQEIDIGAEVHAGILQEYPLYANAAVVSYVTALGQQIVVKSRRPNLAHQFFVLETDVINAFAAPGGYVYVTTGLMRNMGSRAELAGVLGHEVGHVSAYHGVEALELEFGLGLLIDMVLGSDSAAGQVVGYATGFYWNTAHSRDQELESDTLGVEFAHAAGYNPWGLVDFFEFLGAVSGGSGDPISKFMSSHPSSTDRITESSAQIEALGVTKTQAGLVVDDSNDVFMSYVELMKLLPAEQPRS